MSRGRLSPTVPMTQVLDPAWCYSVPHLQGLFQKQGVFLIMKKSAVSFSGFHHLAHTHLPKEADHLLSVSGRVSKCWYGYRWQRFSSLEQASTCRLSKIAAFWKSLNSSVIYSAAHAIREYGEPVTNPLIRAHVCFNEVVPTLSRIALHWYAMEHGLNPEGCYRPDEWLAPEPTEISVNLLPLRRLTPSRLYSIDQIRGLYYPDAQERVVRCRLYLLAREHKFPPCGDGQGFTKVPGWLGQRWWDAAKDIEDLEK